MKNTRVSRKKRELMKTLELFLMNYKTFLGVHYNKEQLDNYISNIVEEMKQID